MRNPRTQACLEKPTVYCRRETLTHIRRNWSNEEFEQSLDRRVDGIPNDETYKDKQYMHKVTEQL